jgi:hypothetical protein
MEKNGWLKSPEFLNGRELNAEQLNDPDYRLKQLQKLSGGTTTITCSKCHHCR